MTIILVGIAKRQQKRAPMEALNNSWISTMAGINDDSRGKPSNRQITVLSEESWLIASQSLGLKLDWLIRRANMIVRGKTFSESDIGCTLKIGQAVFEIMSECAPCYRMDEQIAGLQAALSPAFAGGVCCKVLHGDLIAVGQPVTLQPMQKQISFF